MRILLENKFSLADIREMMGNRFPARSSQVFPEIDPLCGKRESLVAIQRSLAKLNPKNSAVERRRGLSGAEFLEQYYAANRPVILCGLMTRWKACSKWTPDYLKAACGAEVVEIMAAREDNPLYEIEDAPHRKSIRFSDFVDIVMNAGETNDYYLTARNNFFARPGARQLLGDIEPFTEYLKADDGGNGAYLWFGPKGTITPLHHDLMNIFMAQVRGRKQVKLVSPNELDLIYNHRAVYSLVDCGNPDLGRFPKFLDATVIDVELAPGEVLFLPVGWWHYVKALDTSITVSFNNFLFPNEFQWVHPEPRK
ncbi:MAG: cupin-like domain-containing protein [Opitutaceae bacterium]